MKINKDILGYFKYGIIKIIFKEDSIVFYLNGGWIAVKAYK
jgi:hypothetical protein